MEKIKVNNPFIPCDRECPGQGDWDTDYIELEHKVVVKKTGEGEDDYVLITKHIVHKTPIAEVVARDAGTCSIQAIMAQVLKTGDTSLLPTPHPKDGVVNDITGVPDNLMDLDNQMKAMEAKFAALPDSLKKGRSFDYQDP